MKKVWDKFKRTQTGGATFVEYSIVLPICLFVLVFIFMIGYFLNEQANLDAAVNRGVMVATKLYNDPNAEIIMDMGTKKGSTLVGYKRKISEFDNLESDPYRYMNNRYKYDTIENMVESKIRNCITQNQLVTIEDRLGEVSVNFPEGNRFSGAISKKLTVNVTQKFYMPFLPTFLGKNGKGPAMTLESTATIAINNPTEFVRNVDFALDVAERFTGQDIVAKMNEFFDKITSFLGTTE